jgi:hypothetical protein
MAVIKLGGGVSDIRGSIGGTTFSRGPAGAYARQRVKPINPATVHQQDRRALVSLLSTYWSATLTPEYRANWNTFAAATNMTNKVGDVVHITGLSHFLRLNALRELAHVGIQATAPTATGLADQTIAVITCTAANQHINIDKPTSGFGDTEEKEFILVFAAMPMNAGRTASPAGWRFIGFRQGSATPPTWPWHLQAPYPFLEGQNQGVSITHIDLDARVSRPRDYMITCGA